MSNDLSAISARAFALRSFQWIDGHADTWAMLATGESLSSVVHGLAALFRDDEPDVIVGIESRGLALGMAVAVAMGIGFAPIRKAGFRFPGDTVHRQTEPDYRGNRHLLTARRDLFGAGQRVVLVDDWIETGSQAKAAVELIDACGARLVAIAVVVNQATHAAVAELPPVRSLLVADELP